MNRKNQRMIPAGILALALTFAPYDLEGKKFWPDDPVTCDQDNMDIPPVEEIYISDYYDFLENSFFKVGQEDDPVEALDINTLGEVPDSSWFTNRHAKNPLTLEELKRGPNRGNGPDMENPWTIIRGKSGGISPGFVIRDGRGDVYFIKFDPVTHPEMSSSAEIIATKFFHAAGYHVPENYIVNVSPGMMEIGKDATYKDFYGEKKILTREVVDHTLKGVPYREDGTIRVLASLGLPGTPVGPFKYHGTRPDDPNDIFPHQDRRALRGLYVIASWLNHDDSRSINTLDTYLNEGGNRYIKHHLIDFGACLGSGSVKSKSFRRGWAYMFDPGYLFKGIGGLGLWVPKYLKVSDKEIRSVGRFECDLFEPDQWKPEYPNPAFRNMRLADAYWGAKTVMSFSEEEIAAVCGSAELTDPAAEWYIMECLIYRANKIGRFWFSQLLPIDQFEVIGQKLHFKNLSVVYNFAHEPTLYTYDWFRFNNDTLESIPMGIEGKTESPDIIIPNPCARVEELSFFNVKIRGENKLFPKWDKAVTVYLRVSPGRMDVVGIDREE